MSPRLRKWLFLIAAAGLGLFLLWGLLGLPAFGHYDGVYGLRLNRVAVARRHATNVVTTVVFDFRAMDTLGEEIVLFTAVAGAALLLRKHSREREHPPDEDLPGRSVPATSEAVRALGLVLVALTGLFGIYMVLHAHLTPGGGFQGGVVLGSALLLLYVTTDYEAFRRVASIPGLQIVEAVGVGGFLFTGLWALLGRAAFLENVLPLGVPGRLLSAGTIPLVNGAVGVAVGAGLVLLLVDFLEQTIILREGRWWR